MEIINKNKKSLAALGFIGSVIIAIIYLYVVPEQAKAANGILLFLIKYAHSICWVLLAGFFVLWGLNRNKRLQNILAYSALAFYASFMISLLLVGQA